MDGLNQRKIAELSQVSQATVSRVLNADSGVNEDVRRRVLAVVQAHDYVPNARAQSLRGQRSGTLGLVVNRAPEELIQNTFFSVLIVSILQHCGAKGYHLCVDTERPLESKRTIHEELLRTRRVDGLILAESQASDARIERLIDGGFPFVLIGRYPSENTVCSVDNDNIAAARRVTEKLLEHGRRRIAFIGGPAGIYVSEDRLLGYRHALEAAGLPVVEELIANGDFSEESGALVLQKFAALPEPPDAVIAVDDATAIGAMRAARDLHIDIPKQIAFVGFNDSVFCRYFDPPLSSVSIDIMKLGEMATTMLIDQIEHREVHPRRCIVPCNFIERASSL